MMRLNCIKSHTIHFVNRAGAGVVILGATVLSRFMPPILINPNTAPSTTLFPPSDNVL